MNNTPPSDKHTETAQPEDRAAGCRARRFLSQAKWSCGLAVLGWLGTAVYFSATKDAAERVSLIGISHYGLIFLFTGIGWGLLVFAVLGVLRLVNQVSNADLREYYDTRPVPTLSPSTLAHDLQLAACLVVIVTAISWFAAVGLLQSVTLSSMMQGITNGVGLFLCVAATVVAVPLSNAALPIVELRNHLPQMPPQSSGGQARAPSMQRGYLALESSGRLASTVIE